MVDQVGKVGKIVNDNRIGFVVGLSDLGLGMWEGVRIGRVLLGFGCGKCGVNSYLYKNEGNRVMWSVPLLFWGGGFDGGFLTQKK